VEAIALSLTPWEVLCTGTTKLAYPSRGPRELHSH